MTAHRIALTIAGFDPSSGAGITADLKTFAAHDVYGVSCITALTVQSTQGVRRVVPVDSSVVGETLHTLEEDVEIAGIKIGMLGSAGVVEAVSKYLARSKVDRQNIVLDPVLRSSSGAALLDDSGLLLMQQSLLPQVGWITPNVEELAVLLASPGDQPRPVTRASIPAGALLLRDRATVAGNRELNVIVTGGHLDRPDDYYLGRDEEIWVLGERVETTSTHGTGCAFSSALLGQLLRGRSGGEAVTAAKAYVSEALRNAYPIGKGRGPMNHLFRLKPEK